MVDITHKKNTLREATAQAIVKVGSLETIEAIRANQVPKGNVFEMAKTSGLFAVKRTSDIIPDCHPLPIEYTGVEYTIEEDKILINITIKTIYKTGVEVEAMHGASVIALTMYDMLKPIDKNVEIQHIKLLQKKGGKSSYKDSGKGLTASVIVCSDTISASKKEDKAGKAIIEKLESQEITVVNYTIIPDEPSEIKKQIEILLPKSDLIIFTGGTGLSPRDNTPETLLPLLDRRVPGIEEAIRSYGQDRMPYAMLSRSVAGVIDKTLILALPGSTNGAKESMDAIFPAAIHIFKVLKGERHDKSTM